MGLEEGGTCNAPSVNDILLRKKRVTPQFAGSYYATRLLRKFACREADQARYTEIG